MPIVRTLALFENQFRWADLLILVAFVVLIFYLRSRQSNKPDSR